MASGPNVHGSLEKYLANQQTRVTLLERRLATQSGTNTTVLAPAFMTPTSVTGGTFDPQTGRITLTAGATGVQVNGVFTSQYRAYKILFGWYTGGANGLALRLSVNGVTEQAAIHEFSQTANVGNTPTSNEINGGTFWGLAMSAQVGHAGEITVFEPMTTEYTNNQKRYLATVTAYGNSTGIYGGIMAGRDTVAYDGFNILNTAAGPGVTAASGSWVMVVPIPTSQVPTGGGTGGNGAPVAGDIWQIGNESVPPAGTLLCDGREVSRTTYAELYARIGTTYGSGNGTTTFNLPSLNSRQVSQASGSVARISLDGLFPTLSQTVPNLGPDYWDIYYSIDLSGATNGELRARFRSSGADITAAAYFHARDGFAGTNLQGLVTGADYFETAWGNVQNVSGSLRVYRAGKPGDWTNFEGTAAIRGSVYSQGTVQVGGSLQQASDVDGIVFYAAAGFTVGTVLAIPAGGSTAPSVIAYTAGGGGSTPAPGINKGTTSDRNAAYPLPVNTTQQVALHNQKIQWQNTEKGWTEQYFAPAALGGVNAPGLLAGHAAGWYPVSGSLLVCTRIQQNGFQPISAGVAAAPTFLSPIVNIGGFTVTTNNNIIPSIGGFYDMACAVYYSGAAAVNYQNAIMRFQGGSEITAGRVPGAGAGDTQVGMMAPAVLVPSGQGVELIGQSSGANNIFGDGTTRKTFLTLAYAGPPLAY